MAKTEIGKTKNCPHCGEEILAAAKKCKHCEEWLEEHVQQLQPQSVQAVSESPIKHEKIDKKDVLFAIESALNVEFLEKNNINNSPVKWSYQGRRRVFVVLKNIFHIKDDLDLWLSRNHSSVDDIINQVIAEGWVEWNDKGGDGLIPTLHLIDDTQIDSMRYKKLMSEDSQYKDLICEIEQYESFVNDIVKEFAAISKKSDELGQSLMLVGGGIAEIFGVSGIVGKVAGAAVGHVISEINKGKVEAKKNEGLAQVREKKMEVARNKIPNLKDMLLRMNNQALKRKIIYETELANTISLNNKLLKKKITSFDASFYVYLKLEHLIGVLKYVLAVYAAWEKGKEGKEESEVLPPSLNQLKDNEIRIRWVKEYMNLTRSGWNKLTHEFIKSEDKQKEWSIALCYIFSESNLLRTYVGTHKSNYALSLSTETQEKDMQICACIQQVRCKLINENNKEVLRDDINELAFNHFRGIDFPVLKLMKRNSDFEDKVLSYKTTYFRNQELLKQIELYEQKTMGFKDFIWGLRIFFYCLIPIPPIGNWIWAINAVSEFPYFEDWDKIKRLDEDYI